MAVLVADRGIAQPNKPVNGLVGEYFNGPNFERKVLTRLDPAVDFDWNWQSPGPGVQREYFSVRWTGKLYAPVPGRYRFRATVDDGVRVWVNGRKVIDEWRKQDDSNFTGEIPLNGRQLYDLRIEYYNDWKGSVISVFWELPNPNKLAFSGFVPNQVIPAQYLFTPSSRLPRTPAAATRSALISSRAPVATPATNRPTRAIPKPSVSTSAPVKRVKTSVAMTSSSPTTPTKPALAAIIPAVESFRNLKRGEAVILRNVLFEQGDYTLLPTSYSELDKLVRALLDNPTFQVEVAGHTDNVGDQRLNLALSENRAKVVATYLTRHGIDDRRIITKGYGGSRPIADNVNETQRAQNRRVELVVN